jgi:NADPH-dependent 2,4-dienoyl-CoA reductase/sulfur reductase-like enzyme
LHSGWTGFRMLPPPASTKPATQPDRDDPGRQVPARGADSRSDPADHVARTPQTKLSKSSFPRDLNLRQPPSPGPLPDESVKEHDAWGHEDRAAATRKAVGLVRGAVARVQLHVPLERKSVPIHPDVVVVGGGIAGIHAALSLAGGGEAGLPDRTRSGRWAA